MGSSLGRARFGWDSTEDDGGVSLERVRGGPLALDTIPGGISSTETLSAPGSRTSEIDTVGDQDWFRITFQPNVSYQVLVTGIGGTPLTSPFLSLYSTSGSLITTDADGNWNVTTGGGSFFIGVSGAGSAVGGYTISVNTLGSDVIDDGTTTNRTLVVDGPSQSSAIESSGDADWFRVELVAGQCYEFSLFGSGDFRPLTDPYLEVRDASGTLISIDDDGGDGTNALMHFTAPQTGVYYLSARAYALGEIGAYTISAATGAPQDPLDTLDLGFTFSTSNIFVYFATTGQNLGPEGPALRSFTAAEQNAVMTALQTIADVTNLTFTTTSTLSQADFILSLDTLDVGVLGVTYTAVDSAYIVFSQGAPGWTATGLAPGGLGFSVVIHEALHGLGLDHPHYDGGDNQVMQGVLSPFGSYGLYGLNQQIFTIMSYNDGWVGPNGLWPATPSNNYGFSATPMALDIAFLQRLYGADANRNSGDTTYALSGSNPVNPYYLSIWDTGGVDTIAADPNGAAYIDLRAATLQGNGAGGFPSYGYAQNIYGGVTIANGVVIENATGGVGNDTLIGNAAANVLTGNDGNDTISGAEGIDTLLGGAGDDVLDGGAGADALNGGGGADRLDGGAGADAMTGGLGNDRYFVDDAGDTIVEAVGEGIDTVDSSLASFTLSDGLDNLNIVGAGLNGIGNAFANTIIGNALANVISAGGGDDIINGQGGDDQIDAGDGDDRVLARRQTLAGAESNIYAGGNGFDTIDFTSSTGAISINLALGVATGGGVAGVDTISGFERVVGTTFADVIVGDGADNWFVATQGDDNINGGAGVDTIEFTDSGSVNLTAGVGTYVGSNFTLSNIENAINVGSAIGNAANNFFSGRDAADRLEGMAGDDTLVGFAGQDELLGGDGNDLLVGGLNSDILNGGLGRDVAQFDVASTGASWSRRPDGTWSVTIAGQGIDTLTSVELLQFADRNVALDNAFRTFTGDGTSDLLWRNANTGAVAVWQLSGATQTNAYIAGGAPGEWSILGTGDFSGDGRDDIIWRNTTTTAVAVWADGAGTAASIITGVPSNWQFQGVGDFNFDGRDDFVWRDSNDGAVAVWLMNGNTIANQAIVSAAPAAWNIAGIADFDGDGRDDILLRNTDGTVARWTTDGATQTSAAIIGSAPTNWQIQGVGDFDGDGRADILFRNTSDGGLAMWRMNGNATLGVQMVGGAPLSWSIANVGDYNGDGRDDILWHNTDGTVALWTMNGFVLESQAVVAVVPVEWGLI
ncbi:MAG: FG-GAP-like repeat-containing protein [Alphaproteobacteria bacterium]|nr:FG-GAP-like repeat-containing protein [Alphaproteobacteria bacterium]